MISRLAVLLTAGVLAGCPSRSPPATARPDAAVREAPSASMVRRAHVAMGAQISIVAYAERPVDAAEAMQDAFREFDRLERLLTVWRPDSDVSRVNAAAGEKAAVPVAPETLQVLARAAELYPRLEGKFDITFGALAGLWKFDHDQDNSIPGDEDIAARLPLVDASQIRLDPAAGTARIAKKGVRMHLGGIGKGYAVDRAVEILRKRGLENFMIQAGGDLYCAGRKGDRPWRVGIRDPRADRETFFAYAEVTDQTFSTSGDYERFFIKEGRRYHHILDPDTGRPAEGARSVTVLAPDAVTADVLSTGLLILGAEKGLRLADRLPGVGVLIVGRDNQVHVSKRLEGKVRVLFPPTDGV